MARCDANPLQPLQLRPTAPTVLQVSFGLSFIECRSAAFGESAEQVVREVVRHLLHPLAQDSFSVRASWPRNIRIITDPAYRFAATRYSFVPPTRCPFVTRHLDPGSGHRIQPARRRSVRRRDRLPHAMPTYSSFSSPGGRFRPQPANAPQAPLIPFPTPAPPNS